MISFLIRLIVSWCERHNRARHIADRDDSRLTYLIRYYLIGKRSTRWLPVLVLHRFLMSDTAELHDHPWGFISLVVQGGYFEHRPDGKGGIRRRWRGVGSIAWRRATALHRVELAATVSPVYTLVLMFPRSRDWGFAEVDNTGVSLWTRWDRYLAQQAKPAPTVTYTTTPGVEA